MEIQDVQFKMMEEFQFVKQMNSLLKVDRNVAM